MVGGLCASIVLFILKKTMWHEKLTIKNKTVKVVGQDVKMPKPTWQRHEPDWRKK
jgi:hypothetical protein